ncbi:ubiquinone/menaquinone biosynthesis methyltransferase [bacterium]|nr:ubiquinone/menaquinone biosynthesis methyltransferase [bacterium]
MNQADSRTDNLPVAGSPKNSDVRRMFGEITPAYDFLNRFFSGTFDRRWRSLAARAATEGLNPCARILDLATGTGDLAMDLAKAAPAARVHGADFTRPMLAHAAEKFGRGRFEWIEADAMALPFENDFFDALTIAFGLRNMDDRPGALAEMARVVRPGGRVAILEFGRPRNRIWRALFELYLFQIMPRVGRLVSGSMAYLYLAQSIRNFWSADELSAKMRAAGLGSVTATPLMGGIVYLHVGVKEPAS